MLTMFFGCCGTRFAQTSSRINNTSTRRSTDRLVDVLMYLLDNYFIVIVFILSVAVTSNVTLLALPLQLPLSKLPVEGDIVDTL